MSPVFEAIWQRTDLWSLAAMPLLAALVGGLASRIAVWMIFDPLEFIGLRQSGLGWQGLVPARAELMAGSLVDRTLGRFTSLAELFRLMEPEKVAEHVSHSLLGQLDEYVDAIMAEKNAVFWDNLPASVRQRVYDRVRRQMPSILDNLVDDMAQNVEELVDVRQMVVEVLVADPGLLVRIYREIAAEDCRFLEAAGWRLGLLLGVVEAGLWLLLPHHRWLLVCMPLLIGAVVYPAVRRLLFSTASPLVSLLAGRAGSGRDPRLLAGRLAAFLAEDVLSLSSLMRTLMSGARAGRTRAMIKRHMRPLLETGMVRTLIQLVLGVEGYAYLKQAVVDRAVALTMGSLSDSGFNRQRAGQVQELCRERLAALPPEELHDVLRPVFEEGAWVHVLLGAVLGLAAGLVQLAFLFRPA